MGCNICKYSYIDCECTHDMHSAFDVGFKMANDIANEETDRLRAEITQLRAELEQERELADRLAETVRAADYVIKSARPDSGWLVAYKDGIAAAHTRRNK